MKLAAALVFAAALSAAAQPPDRDPVLRAMRDELRRSLGMRVLNLEPPYYISYTLDDGAGFAASATLGGLVSAREDRYRIPVVSVRVGSYRFDNTNYMGSAFASGPRYATGRFPLENAYPLLRRYLWLETDAAYKSALEAISRKRAVLKNMAEGEPLDDYAKAEPVRHFEPAAVLQLENEVWLERLRGLSRILARYPAVRASSVDFNANASTHYQVNSEGTEVRVSEPLAYLRVRASGQARDGMSLRDAVEFYARDAGALPSEAELAKAVAVVGEHVAALAQSPLGEGYSGPVLFEGEAAAQLFAEVLGRNLAPKRRPVTEPGRPGMFAPSELEGRQGARILPEWMDVVDDPTQAEWRGRRLLGSYAVDDEGVAPRPLRLVEKGVLKGFLLTRQPVRGFQGSNGRARLPGRFGAFTASISNLFVHAGETVNPEALRAKLLETCQARGKPYGILVRKMDFPSSAGFAEIRRLIGGVPSGGGHLVSLPLLAYRVYPGGREEPVHGLRFRSLNARSLKDILAAGDDENLFEFLENGAPFAAMGAGVYVAPSSVVAPSVLIDDLELHPLDEELPKLPVVPPPEIRLTANGRP